MTQRSVPLPVHQTPTAPPPPGDAPPPPAPPAPPARHDWAWLRKQAGFAAWSAAYLLRHRLPPPFYYYFGGIGDVFLMTAVLREQALRGQAPALVMTDWGDLFDHNPDVRGLLPVEVRLPPLLARLGRPAFHPYYALDYDPVHDRHPAPPYPIIARMCEVCGVSGPVSIRPYLFLTEAEKQNGLRVPRQVAIMSSGMSAHPPFLNKQWFPDRYQAVVAALQGTYDFVQLGSPADPLLKGALDLRGRTTRRESAAILSRSLAFVGQVGFLMHVACAVECPSVIIYGGREHPSQSGYVCNENLYSPVPCAPCWQQNRCDFGRMCLDNITVPHVIDALHRQVALAGTALPTETYTLPPA